MADPLPSPDIWKFLRRLVPIGDGWVRVAGYKPDSYPEATKCRALAEFKGALYAAVDHPYGLQVWRSTNGTKWQEVVGPHSATPSGFGVMNRDQATDMVVLDGTLYLATKVGVWLTKDGTTWSSPSESVLKTYAFDALAAFGQHVYAATGTEIWRGKGTSPWQRVVGPQANTPAGFGDADVTDITRLTVFSGNLFAGAGMDNPTGTVGTGVWRSGDGLSWTLIKKETGVPGSIHVQALKGFGAHLYVGGYHVLRIHRTDGSVGNWADVTDGLDPGAYNNGAWSAAVYRNDLYVGEIGATSGRILWKSSTGTSWTQVNTNLIGTDKSVVDVLLPFGDHLYLTTRRSYLGPSGKTNKLEIWRYGPRYIPEDLLMVRFKPFAARQPLFRIPPPPVLLRVLWSRVVAVIDSVLGPSRK